MTRPCQYCGGQMKEVAKLKGPPHRRNIHRFKCEECGLEESTSLTLEEEKQRELQIREKEAQTRKRKTE